MKHIWTVLRFMIDNLQNAIDNFISLQGRQRKQRIFESVKPAIPGISIILGISLLERLVEDLISQKPHSGISPNQNIPSVGQLRNWQSHLNLDPNWHGWSELGNFFRIRHCFAHEFGRLTTRQKKHIKRFLKELQKGSILDEGGGKVPGYYEITKGEIILKPESLHYFRKLCKSFVELLQQQGLQVE